MPETIGYLLNVGENFQGQNQNILNLRTVNPVIVLEKRSIYYSVQLSHFKGNEIGAQGKLSVVCKAILTGITYLLKFVLLLENVLMFFCFAKYFAEAHCFSL